MATIDLLKTQMLIFLSPDLCKLMDNSNQEPGGKSQKLCTFLCTLNKKPL